MGGRNELLRSYWCEIAGGGEGKNERERESDGLWKCVGEDMCYFMEYVCENYDKERMLKYNKCQLLQGWKERFEVVYKVL